ncbi:MAG TPA: hypothetical protein VN999_01950 [Thermoanaerobaculia bacterium]|nr:hypothetical protein [Thermoanaerobaculia bacterium]
MLSPTGPELGAASTESRGQISALAQGAIEPLGEGGGSHVRDRALHRQDTRQATFHEALGEALL